MQLQENFTPMRSVVCLVLEEGDTMEGRGNAQQGHGMKREEGEMVKSGMKVEFSHDINGMGANSSPYLFMLH